MLKRLKKYITLESPIEISKNLTLNGDLNYYLDFTAAEKEPFFTIFELDENGIPINDYTKVKSNKTKVGKAYNFTTICMYGLLNLEKYLKTGPQEYLDIFLKQIEFLKTNVSYRSNQIALWETNFDWVENTTYIKSPFPDAMNQGLAISSLVRAYKLLNDQNLLNLAKDGAKIFAVPIEEGGIRAVERGLVFYEEYPAYPLTYVLDGACFGLLGLYDLHIATKDKKIYTLFEEGIKGIEHRLSMWDYNGYWSRYGNYRKVSGIMYHKVNTCILKILSGITGSKKLKQTSEKWAIKNLRLKQRIDIYFQLARLKLRSN